MRSLLIFGLSTALFLGNVANAADKNVSATPSTQSSSAAPSASPIVNARAFVSLAPVPRGKTFQVAVVVDIAHGYHMNSHKPSEEYLIPTMLTPQLPSGIELTDSIYPKGELKNFPFSPNKPLDVYSGSVTLLLKLSARADAPLGETEIPVILRYQACNDTTCLPPVKLPVSVKFEIAKEGVTPREVNPEIFSRLVPVH